MRAQSTIEYLVITAIFIFLLAISYAASTSMGERREAIEAQMEGERTASMLARQIDAVSRSGDGALTSTLVHAYPPQLILVSGSEVLAFGPRNISLAAVPLTGAPVNKTAAGAIVNFSTSQYVLINRSKGVIYVTPLG